MRDDDHLFPVQRPQNSRLPGDRCTVSDSARLERLARSSGTQSAPLEISAPPALAIDGRAPGGTSRIDSIRTRGVKRVRCDLAQRSAVRAMSSSTCLVHESTIVRTPLGVLFGSRIDL